MAESVARTALQEDAISTATPSVLPDRQGLYGREKALWQAGRAFFHKGGCVKRAVQRNILSDLQFSRLRIRRVEGDVSELTRKGVHIV